MVVAYSRGCVKACPSRVAGRTSEINRLLNTTQLSLTFLEDGIMQHLRLPALAVALLFAGIAQAQDKPRPKAELPIRRIVLFSSGVGYVQREGDVEGNAQVELRFNTHDINDLLKSLIVQDRGGGQVGSINYDNRDPVERTLKTFALDLTQHPTLGDLLRQTRGERVEVADAAALGKDGLPRKLTGLVVGVQVHLKPVDKGQVIEVEQLNLLTDEGLQGIPLERVQRVRFLKPELEQEFRKALEVLAASHDQRKKAVTLNFFGAGKRNVRVGYVTESPVWKTSYRLSVEQDGKAVLQGWGIVENTSDDDWKDVRLALVSGRPISFLMDLYEPLYAPRPVVEPELFASLRPRVYDGDLGGVVKNPGPQGPGGPEPDEPAGDRGPRMGWPRRPFGFVNDFASKARQQKPTGGTPDIQEQIASVALPRELGEFFHYDIVQPVGLPRQKSALLPIVNSPVEVTKVSIFNAEVHDKYPMFGLRLKNTSGLHLMQGPITIFDAGSYAGDAQIGNLQPKETRLVSYAVDLGTEVVAENQHGTNELTAVQVSKGVLRATRRYRHTRSYTIKSRSPQARTVLIEHPHQEKRSLVSPEKPAERTRDLYRFEIKAEADKTVRLDVVEDEPTASEIRLTDGADDAIRLFLRASVISAPVREALAELLKRRGQLAESRREIQAEEHALAAIAKDQERMRNNMERVPKESAAFQRYLKKFDEQETDIEARRERVAKLHEAAERQRKELEQFVAGLEVR